MPYKKQWDWDKATEGMRVLLEDLGNGDVTNGIVKEIKRSNKCRMVDGKPVRSTHVDSVTILCDDGSEIVAVKDMCQYRVTLK